MLDATTMPPPIPDLVEGLLPAEEVSILAGASGAGKTFLMFHLVRACQRGEAFFARDVKPDLKVGYIAGDRTWRAYAHTLNAVGVDVADLKIRSLIDETVIDMNRMRRDALGLLMDLLNSLLPCDLAIVDPLVSFFGASPREYHLMAPALGTLSRWCRQTGCTILGTHHSTKARTDFTFKRPQDRINGSAALLGFSSSQLFLMEPEEEGPPHHQLFVTSHTAPPFVLGLQRQDDGTFKPADLEGRLAPLPEDGQLDPVAEKILQALPHQGSGMSVGREYLVQTLREVSAPTVDRRLKRLLEAGWVVRASRGEYQRRTL